MEMGFRPWFPGWLVGWPFFLFVWGSGSFLAGLKGKAQGRPKSILGGPLGVRRLGGLVLPGVDIGLLVVSIATWIFRVGYTESTK